MTTYKDILYKKNDDETWAEWSKRVPDNDEDKLDYIGETIYKHTVWGVKGGEITDLLLGMGVKDLIPLLENEELLDAKIEEAYNAVRKFEEYKMSEEEEMFEEDCLSAEEEARVANEELRVLKEESAEASKKYEEDKEYEEQERSYEIYEHEVYKQPVVTLTVAEMIEALSKLPPDAKLVMTESGFYSKSDFAEVMLPRPYKVANDNWVSDLPTGTQVYIIGHSHQSY
jgi:hypothetical protein